MCTKSTKSILAILFLMLFNGIYAQQWLGRTTSNYAGTYGVYNNASSISDSKYKYYFNFWGRGLNFYNNYLDYNAPIKLNHWANDNYDNNYKRIDDKADYQKNWLLENLNGKDKYFSFQQDIWGPAMMFPVGKSLNMSINTRQRSAINVFGIAEPFARMAFNGIDSSGGIYNGSNGLQRNKTYSNGKFGANAQTYQELSFTFAGTMAKSDKHQLDGGLSVKFIRGLGAAYVKGNGFDAAITGNNSATIQNADIEYAYTDDKNLIEPFNRPYGLFSLQSKGAGAGLDLGLTYTFRQERGKYAPKNKCFLNDRKTDYDFKLSMALNDLGAVKYGRNSTKYAISSNNINTINAPSSVLNGFNIGNQNALDTIGNRVFAGLGGVKSSDFTMALPAAFNLQADIRWTKHFYTALFWNQSLKGINSTGMKATSMVSLVPRIESRGFEFSMPLTLSENYKNFYVGAYTRIGPVFFGSDNLGGLLGVAGNSNFRGADIYGGVSFGIGHCHQSWYEEKVDPVVSDTVETQLRDTVKITKHDTIKIVKRDTIRIVKRDTIYKTKNGEIKVKRDTIYIEKIIKSKADVEKENQLKQKEIELNNKQKQLEQKEKELQEKEKGTYNESEALKNCKNQTIILTNENVVLQTKVNNQASEIERLKKQLDEANKNKAIQDAELEALKKCGTKIVYNETTGKPMTPCELYEREKLRTKDCEESKLAKDNEINSLKNQLAIANKKIGELEVEINNLKKGSGSKNNAEVIKGSDADKLLKANKQLDSLNLKVIMLSAELDKCKKSNSQTEAQIIIKKLEDQVKDLTAQLKVCKENTDVLNTTITQKNAELEACKKNNSSVNEAETLTKLKKCEDEKNLYKAELAELSKQHTVLNAKVVRLNSTIDSLKQVIAKGGNSGNNDEILKKCNETKAEFEAEIVKLKSKISTLETEVNTVKKDNDDCNKRKVELEAEVITLKKKLSETDNSDAAKKNVELEAEIIKLKSKINSLESDVAENKKLSDDCAKRKVELEAEIITLKKNASESDATELNKKISNLEAELVNVKKKSSDCETELTSLKLENDNLKKQKTELEAEIVTLKAKNNSSNCDEYIKQIEDKNKTIEDLKTQNNTLQNKVNNLTNQLNELRTEYNFVIKQQKRCNEKLDSCIKGLSPGNKLPEGGPSMPEGSKDESIEEVSTPTQQKGSLFGAILGALGEAILTSSTNNSSNNGSSNGNTNSSSSSGTTVKKNDSKPDYKPINTGTTKPSTSNTNTSTPTNTTNSNSGTVKPNKTTPVNIPSSTNTTNTNTNTTKPNQTTPQNKVVIPN